MRAPTTWRARVAMAGWAGCVAACSGRPASPEVLGVDPPTVTALAATPIVVHGHGFFAVVETHLGGGAPAVDERFEVWVGGVAAQSVARVDETTLAAVVPAGVELGVHDVRVVTPSGISATAPQALTVVAEPVGLSLGLEDAPGGAGAAVGAELVTAGTTRLLYAVLRDSFGGFVDAASPDWTLSGSIGVLTPWGSAAELSSSRVGVGLVTATVAGLASASAGPFSVAAADATRLGIEDTPGGGGTRLDGLSTVRADGALAVFAVARDPYGNFVGAADVAWSLTSDLAHLSESQGSATVLDPVRTGVLRIVARHEVLGETLTGAVVITPGDVVRVAIEATAAGAGDPLPATVAAGTDLPLYAAGYDADGNYVAPQEVTWTVEGSLGELTPLGTLAVLGARTVGTGAVVATGQAGSARVPIRVVAGPAVALFVEDAPGGLGVAVGDRTLTADQELALFAVGRDARGNFATDVTVDWTVVGDIGAAAPGPSSQTRLLAGRVGVGDIEASDPVLGVARTGWLQIVPGVLHHFTLGPIATPQMSSLPFTLTLSARDADENVVTSFAGTVSLTDDAAKLAPATSGPFSAGQRSEQLTVSPTESYSGDVVWADDGAGHRGQSNAFDVTVEPTSRLVATLSVSPARLVEGGTIEVTLTIENVGASGATGVAPRSVCTPGSAPCQSGSSAGLTLLDGPVPAIADIEEGTSAPFVWHYAARPGSRGSVVFSAYAAGTDVLTGLATTSATAASPAATIGAPGCLAAPPVADAGQDVIVSCLTAAAGGVVLGGAPSASGGEPPYEYAWRSEPTDGLLDPTAANPRAHPAADTVYTLRVTDAAGCWSESEARVDVSDAPVVTVSASPAEGCIDTSFQVSTTVAQGSAPYSYAFDFGDGVIVPTGSVTSATHVYNRAGWFPVTITVTDSAACFGTARTRVLTGSSTSPGLLSFTIEGSPTALAAGDPCTLDAAVAFKSGVVRATCGGGALSAGVPFTVEALKGTLADADGQAAPGVQVLTGGDGKLHVHLCADAIGDAQAQVLVEPLGASGISAASTVVSGSASPPHVVDFAPSGLVVASPVAVVVRFDEDMDPGSIAGALALAGSSSGSVGGAASFDAASRLATFVPAQGLDVGHEAYTLTISASAADAFGNGLDGNWDGAHGASPGDDVRIVFGAVDVDPPLLECGGFAPVAFSPDGDGTAETSSVTLTASQASGHIALVRCAMSRAPAGPRLRTLAATVAEDAAALVVLRWDGRDEHGTVVPNGAYLATCDAFDTSGNASRTCTSTVSVASAIDAGAAP